MKNEQRTILCDVFASLLREWVVVCIGWLKVHIYIYDCAEKKMLDLVLDEMRKEKKSYVKEYECFLK